MNCVQNKFENFSQILFGANTQDYIDIHFSWLIRWKANGHKILKEYGSVPIRLRFLNSLFSWLSVAEVTMLTVWETLNIVFTMAVPNLTDLMDCQLNMHQQNIALDIGLKPIEQQQRMDCFFDMNINNICRVCLEKNQGTKKMCSIFQGSKSNQFSLMIMACASVQVINYKHLSVLTIFNFMFLWMKFLRLKFYQQRFSITC